MTGRLEPLLARTFVIVLTFGALIAGSWTHVLPERDAGVFLYVAQRLGAGAVIYRDVWDHKPPLVYVIDGVALFLTRDPLVATRLVEAATLLAGALVGLAVIARWLDRRTALFATSLWVLTAAALIEGGNGVEVVALPLQFAAFWLVGTERARPSLRPWLGQGVLLAAAVLIKPTLIGTWIAIVLVVCGDSLIRGDRRSAFLTAFGIAAGSAMVLAPVILLGALAGALPAAFDALVVYNARYSSVDWPLRVGAVAHGVVLLSTSGLAPLGAIGWLVAVVRLVRRSEPTRTSTLLRVAVVALPVEVALAATSGRDYPHYYLPWLPALGILAAFAFSSALAAARARIRTRPIAAVVFVVTLIWLIAFDAAVAVRAVSFQASAEVRTRLETIAYVQANTSASDRVLVWGAETVVNAMSGRAAPGPFAYAYPLFTRGYQSPELTAEFLHDLDAEPPLLIIDGSRAADGLVAPLSATEGEWRPARSEYALPPGMQSIREWLAAHYTRDGALGPEAWPVYRRAR